jgi:hypothetical protein
MTTDIRPPSAYTKGYALCSPDNILQPDSFRHTEAKAIAARFRKKKKRKKQWKEAQDEGWTVKFVYMRMFVPVFYSSNSERVEQDNDNTYDEDDYS